MTTPGRIVRALGFATLTLVMQIAGVVAGFYLGIICGGGYAGGFVVAFIGGCSAPFIAGLVSRRLMGVPRRPAMAVLWIAAGCGLAVAASMLTGQRGQPEGWMGLAYYTSMGAVFVSALIFAAVEHRLG